MPRILGLNLVALIVATLAFYAVDAVWYGALFAELWTGLWGFTDAQMDDFIRKRQARAVGRGAGRRLGARGRGHAAHERAGGRRRDGALARADGRGQGA